MTTVSQLALSLCTFYGNIAVENDAVTLTPVN